MWRINTQITGTPFGSTNDCCSDFYNIVGIGHNCLSIYDRIQSRNIWRILDGSNQSPIQSIILTIERSVILCLCGSNPSFGCFRYIWTVRVTHIQYIHVTTYSIKIDHPQFTSTDKARNQKRRRIQLCIAQSYNPHTKSTVRFTSPKYIFIERFIPHKRLQHKWPMRYYRYVQQEIPRRKNVKYKIEWCNIQYTEITKYRKAIVVADDDGCVAKNVFLTMYCSIILFLNNKLNQRDIVSWCDS